jgi:hypothetical protein
MYGNNGFVIYGSWDIQADLAKYGTRQETPTGEVQREGTELNGTMNGGSRFSYPNFYPSIEKIRDCVHDLS